MLFIEDTPSLKKLCKTLSKEPFLAIDTEFVREKTYYPKLCLIQIGYSSDAAIIDPLAPNIDLEPFLKLLSNKKILKVFHSGRQDIEIFYHLTGKTPKPVFDTQIAASVCGFGHSISYDALVYAVTKIEIDKSSRLTDWSLRPLEKSQLEYALRDVTFLIPCYEYLQKYLKKHNREHWIDEETADLLNEKYYKIDPDAAWQRLKYSGHNPHFLAALKALAAWREKRAMKYNIPKRSILKDEILISIASTNPKTVEELKSVRNIRADVSDGKLGLEIMEALNAARHEPPSRDLKKIDRERKVHIPSNAAALTEVLKLLLKVKCEQEGVVQSIVADEEDIRNIACGNDAKNRALEGWRFEIFGRDALAFRKGIASLSYDTKKKQIVINIKDEKNN